MSRAWMPLYVADYLADTGHLSAAEHGGYLLLIMHYWQNGGLPTEDRRLARIARMSPAEWGASRDTLAELFGGAWVHKRIDAELKSAAEASGKARAKAVKRWQGHAAADAGADAAACAGADAAAVPGHVPEPCKSQSQSQSHKQSPPAPRGTGRARALPEYREIEAALEGVLSPERAQAVIAHRRTLKKPLTLHAARLLANQLALAAEPDRAADLMILRGWQGFAPEWGVSAGLALAVQSGQSGADPPSGVRISPVDDPVAWEAWRQARGGRPLPTDKTGCWTVPNRLPPMTPQTSEPTA
ncbi:YdaU family protein [Bosea sp. 2KB_26]|uniref:YdaU family protein n=1 Tax=Bosea sp. 2KB_26 TaxID=3237475 RepID=UPI003F902076